MGDTDHSTPGLSLQEAMASARPVIEQIVWCTLATVSPDGAPRCRIVHPIWDWDTATGWITSRATPLRRRHLAHQSLVSCSYWSPAHDAAFVDCRAEWVRGEDRRRVWERCLEIDPPMGFDPTPMFPGGPDDPGFAPMSLQPTRIRVTIAAEMSAGRPPLLWTA